MNILQLLTSSTSVDNSRTLIILESSSNQNWVVIKTSFNVSLPKLVFIFIEGLIKFLVLKSQSAFSLLDFDLLLQLSSLLPEKGFECNITHGKGNQCVEYFFQWKLKRSSHILLLRNCRNIFNIIFKFLHSYNLNFLNFFELEKCTNQEIIRPRLQKELTKYLMPFQDNTLDR